MPLSFVCDVESSVSRSDYFSDSKYEIRAKFMACLKSTELFNLTPLVYSLVEKYNNNNYNSATNTSIEAAKPTGSTSTAKSRRLDSSEKMTIVNLALKIINECFILDTKEIQVCCCCQIYIYFEFFF